MLTWLLFGALVLGIGACMARDLAASRINTRRLLALGAVSTGSNQTRAYLLLGSLWTIAAITEVVVLGRGFSLVSAVLGVSVLMLGRYLRREAREALGQRWTLDVVSLAGHPLVTGQIYKRMRHPEYVGTLLLFAGAPIIHGAWLTAALSLVIGSILLGARVRLEEEVLDQNSRYLSHLGNRPRFFPRKVKDRSIDREPSRPTRLRPRGRPGDLHGGL